MRVAVAEAADVAVLKATPLGGVRRALRVAEACGLPCVVSSALETSVGLAAGVALAGALPSLDFACGLGTLSLLTSDVVGPARSLRPVDGYLPVAPVPPTPDPAVLARYEITDPARAAWWRAGWPAWSSRAGSCTELGAGRSTPQRVVGRPATRTAHPTATTRQARLIEQGHVLSRAQRGSDST